MRIVVSACLLGENCKYSGGNNENKAVLNFVKDHELIPVCPEVLGGLPVPRMPAEIVNGVVRCNGRCLRNMRNRCLINMLCDIGQNIQSNSVSGIFCLKIGGIIPVRHSLPSEIRFYIRPSDTKQRPNNTAAHHRNTG